MEFNIDIFPERFGNTPTNTPILFDLDGTLVSYDRDNRLSWSIPEYVNIWLEKHFGEKIIIISNQKNYDEKISNKIKDIIAQLRKSVIVDIYICKGNSWYRKPSPKIFVDFICKKDTEYIYVGDAAGREDDFSDSDLLFAYNANIYAENMGSSVQFSTPEEFFLTVPQLIPQIEINTNKYDQTKEKNIIEKLYDKLVKNDKTLIVMTGLPGSGKSYFTDYLVSYMEINEIDKMDKTFTIVTKDKDDIHQNKPILVSTKISKKKVAEISEYNIIIWDTTAYSAYKRREIMDLFPGHTAYIVWMKTTIEQREWLRFYRTITTNITLPDIAIRMQEKNFEVPKNDEVDKDHLITIDTFSLIDFDTLGIEGKYLC